MNDSSRAAVIALLMGVDENQIVRADPNAIRAAYAGPLDSEWLDVALQPFGEAGNRVDFWQIQGEYYFDDPTFSDAPVKISELRADAELGLRVREEGED